MRINEVFRTVRAVPVVGTVLLWICFSQLAACSRDPVSMPLPSDPGGGTREEPLPEGAVTVQGEKGSQLTITPVSSQTCSDPARGSAMLEWKAPATGQQGVRLQVSNQGSDARQVFAAGGVEGQSVAEGWVTAGVTFHLMDVADGKELLVYAVKAMRCVSP